jgi:hypothetical protein
MFEAFKVGITIALTNTVSSALATMGRDFDKTDEKAVRLRTTLDKIKVLGTLGIVSGALGYAGFKILDKTYEVAKEYENTFARFKALNLGDVMNRNADNFARATNAIGVSSTEMMATLRDLTAVTGDPKLAMQLAPKFAQMSFANQAVFGEGGMKMDAAQIRALEKIIEIKGGYKDASTFLAQADMMQKVISGTGGMVKPSDFLAFIKTAGVSGRLLDNEMFYYTMEPLIQEMSGNRVGTGTMSAYNNLAQGRSTVRAAREMMKLGLLSAKDVDFDKIGQVKAIHPGGLKGFDQFTSDPYHWMQQVLVPALTAAGMTTQKQMLNEMGAIFGNRTGSNLFSLMLMQQDKINKNVAIDKNAMGREDLLAMALKTPRGAELAYAAAMDRFETAAGRALVPIVIPALLSAAKALNFLADAAARHPNAARDIIYFATALSGLLVVTGVVAMGAAAFLALHAAFAVLAPIFIAGGAIAGIVAGIGILVLGAYEIYAHWSYIKGGLAQVWNGIVNWLDSFYGGITGWVRRNLGINIGPSGNTGSRGGMSSVSAPPSNSKIVIENALHLDGRVIGQSVTEHLYNGMNVMPSSGSGFDGSMSLIPSAP